MKYIAMLLIAGCLAVAAGAWWVEAQIDAPLMLPEGGVVLEVRRGASLRNLLEQGQDAGWLSWPRVVAVWAKWEGLDRGIHVGEYRLNQGLTPRGLLLKLASGNVISYSVTLPEGITLLEAIARLGRAEALESVLETPNDPRLLALVAPHSSAEGWFLPETYQYTKGSTDFEILSRANAQLNTVLNDSWRTRDVSTPLKSPYEALILASIIERETSIPSERPAIAGVFSRRLQNNMRLQTDPTVIYGLGGAYTGNLSRKHLSDDSNPWNTYRIKGLPPTPIALPGRAAIAAAVTPAQGEALYFVAKGDGYHAFAATLEEHNANVQRYQNRRRADYRSTPKPGVVSDD